jgi:hypothetical protein
VACHRRRRGSWRAHSGSRCSVTGRARQLHPRITSLSPRLFSPQRNGVKDATTLRFYVPDREHATIAVTNGRGQAVRRADVGNVRRGSHTWTWNGRTRSGTVVPSGRYRITVNTSRVIRQTLVRGAVWTSATVDDLAPRITRLRAPSTIYPVRDRYKDALVVTGYLGESALIALAVSNTAGRTVKSVPNPPRRRSFLSGMERTGRGRPDHAWHVSVVAIRHRLGGQQPRAQEPPRRRFRQAPGDPARRGRTERGRLCVRRSERPLLRRGQHEPVAVDAWRVAVECVRRRVRRRRRLLSSAGPLRCPVYAAGRAGRRIGIVHPVEHGGGVRGERRIPELRDPRVLRAPQQEGRVVGLGSLPDPGT